MKNLAVASFLLILIFSNHRCFSQLTLSAEIRPRAEFRYGFKTLRNGLDRPAFFVEQRTRLYAQFEKEKLIACLALQDVRIWGDHNQVYKSDPSLDNIYEGWARYFIADNWSFKIGRQALDYNNARFLGDLDWAQQGRSHDALLFIYDNKTKNTQLHVGGAFNQSGFEPTKLFGTEYFGVANYKTMQFAWFDKKFERGDLSILFQNDGRQVAQDTSLAYRQTYGVIGNYNQDKLKFGLELYYQGGKDEFDIDVNAYLLALNVTYRAEITPVTLGFDYLSGTSIVDEEDRSFQPLYGTNHKFYGFMDYFYVGNPHGQIVTFPAGLMDIYLKTKFRISDRSSLLVDLHNFTSGVQLYDPEDISQEITNQLGTEVDLIFNHKAGNYFNLFVGYSSMFAGESMEVVKGRGDHSLSQHWAWAMIAFKPTLFTSKKD